MHSHERLTEKPGVDLPYTWTKKLLQAAALVDKAPGRGRYSHTRWQPPMVGDAAVPQRLDPPVLPDLGM
jgi:hypothetical protein